MKPKRVPKNAVTLAQTKPAALLTDVRELILSARQTVARGVNAALVVLYWNIGQRIRRDILKERRAEYGERIVAALGRQFSGGGTKHFADSVGRI